MYELNKIYDVNMHLSRFSLIILVPFYEPKKEWIVMNLSKSITLIIRQFSVYMVVYSIVEKQLT